MAEAIKYWNGTMRFKKDGEALVSGSDNGFFYDLRYNINGQQFVDGEITDFHVVIRNLQASKRFEDKLDFYKFAPHGAYKTDAWFHNEKNPSVELVVTAGDYPAPGVVKFNLTGDAISALGVDLENLSGDIKFFVTIEQYLTPLEKLGKNYADEDAADAMAPIAGSFGGSGNIADTVVGYDKNLVDRFAKKVVLCHLEPPFEKGEEERTEAYKALKNFIESEANTSRMGRPTEGMQMPMTQVVNYLSQLGTNSDQLSSSEKAAYWAFCETMVPRYGVILELTDGRKFDIPPVSYRDVQESSYAYRKQNPFASVGLITEADTATAFAGGIDITVERAVVIDGVPYNVDLEIRHSVVFDDDESRWKINEDDRSSLSIFAVFGDHIKSVDIYVIQ